MTSRISTGRLSTPMRTTGRAAALLAAVVLAGSLAACGGGDEPESPAPETEAAASEMTDEEKWAAADAEREAAASLPEPTTTEVPEYLDPKNPDNLALDIRLGLEPETIDLGKMTEHDLTLVDLHEGNAQDKVERYGADVAYVAAMRSEPFLNLPGEAHNESIAAAGHTYCAQLDEGMTVDQIYAKAYEDEPATVEPGDLDDLSDAVNAGMYYAGMYLCPEHETDVKGMWNLE